MGPGPKRIAFLQIREECALLRALPFAFRAPNLLCGAKIDFRSYSPPVLKNALKTVHSWLKGATPIPPASLLCASASRT